MARRRHKQRLRAYWDAVRTSLWFVPALMGLAALGLAPLAIQFDGSLGPSAKASFPWLVYVSPPDEARDLLATLLSSMIAMASLVFSITMVVLTLAAGQFGPRLIRNFMASRQTQIVLGTFVMTILYCLLILAAMGWRGEGEAVAYPSASLAILLSAVSVGLLVLHIHALATSIMSETVIEMVGRELDQGIAELPAAGAGEDPEAALPDDFSGLAFTAGTGRSGYVQAIEFEQIVEAAQEADAIVGLYFRAGDYLTGAGREVAIYPPGRASPELLEAVADALVHGVHRTPVQDPEFSIRHLVEIAVRALSPGINDPYTAVAVIHRLTLSLSRLLGKGLPTGVLRDSEGTIRVVCPRPSDASVLGASFDQIRQSGASHPIVLIHLLGAVGQIAPCARTREQREALAAELRKVEATAERSIADESDLSDIRAHARKAEVALGG